LQKIKQDLTHKRDYGFRISELNEETIWREYKGDFFGNGEIKAFIHFSERNHNRFFIYDNGIRELSFNFPHILNGNIVFADTNGNGIADVILAHSNGFIVYNFDGKRLRNVNVNQPDFNDSSGFGLMALNATSGNNQARFMGGFSRNRVIFFDENFNELTAHTQSFANPNRAYPFISRRNIYLKTDNGRIHNISQNIENPTWSKQGGNYFRNHFWQEELINIFYQRRGVFVSDQTFVYPNPFINRLHNDLRFNIMTTKDTVVNIRIYNISGQLVARLSNNTTAYFANSNNFILRPETWSSGVYFAILEAEGESKVLRFGVER
jgi:hypothetical protein